MINKNASKLPEFTQDSLSPIHDSSSTNNWILHLPLPKNEKLRERKVEERVIRSSWTGRPPAGRRTTGAARHEVGEGLRGLLQVQQGWRATIPVNEPAVAAQPLPHLQRRLPLEIVSLVCMPGDTSPCFPLLASSARDSRASVGRLRFQGRAWSRVQGCWWFALCIYVYPSVDRVATVWTCAHTTGATRRRVVGVGGGGRGSIITRNCDRRAGY